MQAHINTSCAPFSTAFSLDLPGRCELGEPGVVVGSRDGPTNDVSGVIFSTLIGGSDSGRRKPGGHQGSHATPPPALANLTLNPSHMAEEHRREPTEDRHSTRGEKRRSVTVHTSSGLCHSSAEDSKVHLVPYLK